MPTEKLIGFVHNPRVPEAAELVASLVDTLGLRNASWVSSAAALDPKGELVSSTSAVITAGGDGTILRVAQLAAPYSVPILGINLGRVGFMTELTVDEAAERIPGYLDGSPRIEQRMMLQASVASGAAGDAGVTLHALNDMVVSRGSVVRLLDIDVSIDGVPMTTYRADGVIIATATGSTGYALAAGGTVLYPEAQVMLIQPVAAHMGLETGLVVPGDSVVELVVSGAGEAAVSADGIRHTVLGGDDRVVVRRSPHVTRFLRADPPSRFYAELTRRLGVKSHPGPRIRQL